MDIRKFCTKSPTVPAPISKPVNKPAPKLNPVAQPSVQTENVNKTPPAPKITKASNPSLYTVDSDSDDDRRKKPKELPKANKSTTRAKKSGLNGADKPPKPSKQLSVESGSEEDEVIAIKPSKKKKVGEKRKSMLLSDSDEDMPVAKQSKRAAKEVKVAGNTIEKTLARAPQTVSSAKPSAKEVIVKEQVKIVSAEAFFGRSMPARQSEKRPTSEHLFNETLEDFSVKTAAVNAGKTVGQLSASAKSSQLSPESKQSKSPKANGKTSASATPKKSPTKTSSASADKKSASTQPGQTIAEPVTAASKKISFTAVKPAANLSASKSHADDSSAKKADTKSPSVSPSKQSPHVMSPSINSRRGYYSMLHRAGPQALGTRTLPNAVSGSLKNVTFVFTGVLESVEREEIDSFLKACDAKVTSAVSGKTTYLVMGRDAGQSKAEQAKKHGTKVLSEDELFDLIDTTLKNAGSHSQISHGDAVADKKRETKSSPKKTSDSAVSVRVSPRKQHQTVTAEPIKTEPEPAKKPSPKKTPSTAAPARASPKKSAPTPAALNFKPTDQAAKLAAPTAVSADKLMWVEKYRPKTMKDLVGLQGEKSPAKKLLTWLSDWFKYRSGTAKAVFNKFNDNGSVYKAALLSGSPGIGKTTTAQLVAKAAGFEAFELNASDTRSKRFLASHLADMLKCHSIGQFAPGSGQPQTRHLIIMDEVDGMAGNEDRGGMQELIALIKQTRVPIVCICNDRQHQKIRSLANYCFDLRFSKPRLEQIRAAMMSLAAKENLKVDQRLLDQLIESCNQDIRQIINQLEMWSASAPTDQSSARFVEKDVRQSPFELCRELFLPAPNALDKKLNMFFHDYQLMPLFAQENYLNVQPGAKTLQWAARSKRRSKSGRPASSDFAHLTLLRQTADSISQSDLIDRQIFATGDWKLLNAVGVFSCVVPGHLMAGRMHGMIQFPQWLGQNSKAGKTHRLLHDLALHMSLRSPFSTTQFNTDILPFMRNFVLQPLVAASRGTVDTAVAVDQVLGILAYYDLTREDFDSIIELAHWFGDKDATKSVDSKVKATFTRAYNKHPHLLPYGVDAGATRRKRAGAGDAEEADEEDADDDATEAASSGDEQDDPMVKKVEAKPPKKQPAAKPAAAKAAKPAASKSKQNKPS